MESQKESVELKNIKEIKLFGKYSFEGVVINDSGLKNVISLKPFIIPKTVTTYDLPQAIDRASLSPL